MHKGAILFLEISQGEDSPMPLYRVRADLVDLINTGLFDDIVGLVFGRTYLYDEKLTDQLESLLAELVDGNGFKWPVLTGVDIGHTSPMITVPFGAEALLDNEAETFSFLEDGVM
jgi:muramoyltetrapeptide carboxypeptidase LdcA involved in peptidoglycan recycling